MSELQDLQAELEVLLGEAEDTYNNAVASNPPVPVPAICVIPPFPGTATDEQKIAALRCALDMVQGYIDCINGPANNWASCVAGVCSAFVICWNAAFGVT